MRLSAACCRRAPQGDLHRVDRVRRAVVKMSACLTDRRSARVQVGVGTGKAEGEGKEGKKG